MTNNVTVTAPANGKYEVSTSQNSGYGNSVELSKGNGTLANTTIYIRLKSDLAGGNISADNINITSTGATSQTISVSGSVPYKITWMANGSTHATTYVTVGSTLALPATDPVPNTCGCTGKAFYGWYGLGASYSHASTAPTIAAAGNAVNADKTYHAVFVTEDTSGKTEETITLNYNSWSLPSKGYSKLSANGFTIDQGHLGNGNCIQMNSSKGTGKLYNTTAISGLKSVTVNVSSGSAQYTITTGTSQNPTTNSQYGTTGGTYDAEEGDSYFQLQVSGASYFSSIVLTYEESSTTYTNFETTCCTPLASINGSVSETIVPTQNSVTIEWDNVSGASNWAVACKQGGSAYAAAQVGNITDISNNTRKQCTISNLAAGTAYTFTVSANLTGYCTSSVSEDVNGSTAAAHTITANAGEHGSVSVSGTTITATPNTGYKVADGTDGYTITAGNGNATVTNNNDNTLSIGSQTGDITLTVNFVQIEYTVTMAKDPANASVTISGNQSSKHYGDEITVSVTNHDGYLFTGWTASPAVTFDDASAETAKFTMPNSNVTITASFCKIYSVAEALEIIDALQNNNVETENAVYVSGIVTSSTRSCNSKYNSLTYFISDDGEITSELKIYSGMGLADNTHPTGADFNSVDDLQNGDEVIVFGKLLKYKNGSNPVVPEMNYPNYIYSLKRLSSIAVKTAPTKKIYTANEQFNPAGLIITLTYSNSDTEDVAYAGNESDFTFSPTTSANLTAANSAVTITYKGKSVDQAITVTRIATELGWSAASYEATQGDDYSFPTLTTTPNNLSGVTYTSSNTNVATIAANGAITVKTYGETTITASFAQTNVYAAATPATYTLTILEDMTPRLVVDPSSLTFSGTPKDDSEGKTFNLVGTHLGANATLAITSATEGDAAMFSVTGSVAKDGSGAIDEDVTVTYHPTTAGSHSATLTISSTGAADVTVELSGSALETDIYKSALHTEIAAWSDYDAGKKMAGNGYSVPNPGSVLKGSDNCEGNHYRFAGWVEDADKEAPAGNIIAASGNKNASGKTYWAVWEKETAVGDDTYEMTTSVAVGDVVVIAQIDDPAAEKTGKELSGFSSTSTVFGTASDFVTLPAGTKEWTVVNGYNSTGVAFQNGSNYLYWTSGNSLNVNATLSANTSWTVTTVSEHAKITNNATTTRVICWNQNDPRFATYDDKKHGEPTSNGGSKYFYYPVFYKKVPGVVYGDPITYCCTPHDIILADTDGEVYSSTILTGVYGTDPTSACAGTEVELTALAEEGYEFGEWTVTYVDGESQQQSVTVENNKFSMPDFETTVSATFTKIAVTGVTINGYSSVAKGANITLTLEITPSTARPTVEWSSSNNDIATVVDGVVTGVAQGSVTITATVDGTDYTKDITVTRETKLNSITVVNPKTTYTLNEEFVAPRVDANYLYVDDESEAPTLENIEGATFDGFDNQHAGEQAITVSYGGKTTTYDVAVSAWTLNLQTKSQTGPATVTPATTQVTIDTYGSEINLTDYYVENLCNEYTQVGFIASSTDVDSETEPENLLTAYTPTADNQTLYAVFSHTGYTGETLIEEDFSSYTASSNTAITGSAFDWLSSTVTRVYPDYQGDDPEDSNSKTGCLKFGSNGGTGSFTTVTLDLSHKFKVSLDVKKYSNEGANIKITADETEWTSNTTFAGDKFTSISHEFSAVGKDKQITIETSGANRAYIDNIKIETLDEVAYSSVYDCRSDKTITYAIAEEDAAAGATGACEQETVKQGDNYTVCTDEPTWAGHEFAGWSDGVSIVGATIENVQALITLTATWNEIVANSISISSDAITAGTMTLDDGRTATLTVTFDPTDTYNKTLTWSEDSHYTITDNGDGTYQIQAKDVTAGITVTATTANSKSASFSLVVNAATKLTGLTLEGLTEANTFYTIGDAFSTTGIVVNTTVNMGDAPENVEADFSTPDMTSAGVKTVTVEYTHPEYGYASTTYEITVNAKYVHLYRNEALIETRTLNSTAESVTLPDGDNATWAPKVAGYSLIGFADAANAQYPKVAAGASYVPSVREISLYALYTNVAPTYTLISSAGDLVIGRSIIIATKDAASDSKHYAIGELNNLASGQSNNRKGVEVTKGTGGTTLTAYAGATEFILMEGKNSGTYALYDPINGKYLCAQTTDKNYLKLEEELSVNGSWTISTYSVVSNIATGNHKYLYFNYNNGTGNSRLFSCYEANKQSAIAVYQSNVEVEYDPTMEMEVTTAQTLNTADVDESVNVIVKNGGELTVGSELEINNIIVEAGGKVTGSATLNVQDLTINTQSGKSGQVTGSNVSVNGDIYLEIKLDASGTMDPTKYYCISAPFDVNMNGGFFWGNGDQMGLNQDFQLFEYQGSKRASTGNGWQRVSGTMKKNTAYFIGFDDENTNNQNVIRLKAANKNLLTDATIELQGHEATYGQDATEIAKNSNWNGLGNPTLHYVNLNKTVSVFEPSMQGYDPHPWSEHTLDGNNGFVVGTAFFVQGTGDLSFNNTAAGEYRAPKRESEKNYSYCVEIAKENARRYDNRLYVTASEMASSSFEEEKDLPTLNGETSKYGALLWTKNYGMRLAIEDAPIVNSSASYDLGIYAPANGTYIIRVAEAKDNADLYLTQEGAIIWNLSMGEYELDLTKGTTNGYGLLLVEKAPGIATGVDEISGEKAGVQKIVLEDKVFILRGGKMYDVTGKAVK